MFWIARILAVVALIAVLMYGVGLLIPAERSVSKTTIIDAPPSRVFQTMTEIERHPQWRSDVRNVQIESRDKLWAWNETRDDGAVVHIEERVKDPTKRYEIEFHDSSGVHGSWVAEFEASNEDRTKLTCTETRIIDQPFFRLPALVMSNGGTDIDVYLGDLNREAAGDDEKPKDEWSPIPRPTATPTSTSPPPPGLEPAPTPTAAPSGTPTSTPSAVPTATPKSTVAPTPI